MVSLFQPRSLRCCTAVINNATATAINVDGASGGGPVHGLLRFDDILGSGVNQIAVGSTIASASLELQVTNAGEAIQLHRMLQGWNDTDSWNSLVGGIQVNNVEAASAADATTGAVGVGLLTIDVTASLTAWIGDPAANLGWALLSTGTNGLDYFSAEGTTPPRLVVEFTAASSNNVTANSTGDGFVTGLDFLMWQIGFGTLAPNATKAVGDADGDLDVDGDDLAYFKYSMELSMEHPRHLQTRHLAVFLPM